MARADDVFTVYELDGNADGRVTTRRKGWLPATDPLLLFCNGWSKRGLSVLGADPSGDGAQRVLAASCARQGLTVLAHDFTTNSDVDGWGNAEVIAKVAAQKTWGQGTGGTEGRAKSGKIVLIGISMGACSALNYALSLGTPASTIAGIALLNPALDPADIAGAPRDTFLQASIYAAFGGSAGTYATNGPAYNPNLRRGDIAAMGIPIRAWYSTDDPIALSSITADFGTKTGGVTLRPCGAQGHAIDAHPMEEIACWLRDRVNA